MFIKGTFKNESLFFAGVRVWGAIRGDGELQTGVVLHALRL